MPPKETRQVPRKRDEALHAMRQQQILDAAKKCFIANGFHRTSMREIFKAANISAGGAYNYFASKDDIVKALVAEENDDITWLVERLKKSRNPLKGVAQLVHDAIRYTTHDDATLAAEVYAESCRNPEVGALSKQNTAKAKTAFFIAIQRGAEQGFITKQYSAEDLSVWVLALIEGYIGQIASDPKLNSKQAARMAKISTINLLGDSV